MILRDYQKAAVDDVMAHLDRRPVLVMPTGAGKTVTASSIVHTTGCRTLWLAHRRELVHQAAQTLHVYGLDVGILMAGESSSPLSQVQVASVGTVESRGLGGFDPELTVVDECHRVRAPTYERILESIGGAPVVGLTATPFRLDGKGLGDTFGHLTVACYPADLCRAGTLVDPIVYAPSLPDLSDVPRRNGDYSTKGLAVAMARPKIVGDIVTTWKRRAEGRRTVVFAVNVAHSQQIVGAFRAAGVVAEHIDGSTSRAQRDATLQRLRTGYTSVVSNCAVLTEGWDLPALEVAIIARPTQSLCFHLQAIGRIMRAADAKTGAVVLDHAGNHHQHGPVTQRIRYSLDDGAVTQASDGPQMRRCPECYLMVDPSAVACPDCGWVFQAQPQRMIEHVDGELVEFKTADDARAAMRIDDQQASWDRLEARRRALGYRDGWTHYEFKRLHGFAPLVIDGDVVDGKKATKEQKRKHFAALMATAKARGYKRGWANHRYRAAFGVWPKGVA